MENGIGKLNTILVQVLIRYCRLPEDLRFFDNSNQSYLTYAPYGYGYQLNNSGYDYYGNNKRDNLDY